MLIENLEVLIFHAHKLKTLLERSVHYE